MELSSIPMFCCKSLFACRSPLLSESLGCKTTCRNLRNDGSHKGGDDKSMVRVSYDAGQASEYLKVSHDASQASKYLRVFHDAGRASEYHRVSRDAGQASKCFRVSHDAGQASEYRVFDDARQASEYHRVSRDAGQASNCFRVSHDAGQASENLRVFNEARQASEYHRVSCDAGQASEWFRVSRDAGQASEYPPNSSCQSQYADNVSSHSSGLATRRELVLFGLTGVTLLSEANAMAIPKESVKGGAPDTTITDRVFFNVSVCAGSSVSSVCSKEADPLGRIVIGLYGKQVPQTVENFKAMCAGKAGSTYQGTSFHKIIRGEFIQAGRQGKRERGEVSAATNLKRNLETINPNSFKLRHNRPGTVSLCLDENDDEDNVRLRADYRNVEFLITTGPGPVPRLDNRNIVFGTVLEGMDVVAALSALPTYKPGEGIRQFNEIAELLGDDRAANARAVWNRPLNAVVISKCGEL